MSPSFEPAESISELRHISLAEAAGIAEKLELAWQVETWSTERSSVLGMLVQADRRPDGVSVLASGRALETSRGAETDDGEFEYSLQIPSHHVATVLTLSNARAQCDVRLIVGDHAAVAVHGFREESAGRRAPVCVPVRELRQALEELARVN